MKQLPIQTLTALTIIANTTQAEPPKKFKSYVELQAERVATADAAYARHKAEREATELVAKEQAVKVAAERKNRLEAEKAYLRQVAIVAAGAARINVQQLVW